MRMKSLMTAAEAAGYVMAPFEDDYADDEAASAGRLALPAPSEIVPDVAPSFDRSLPADRPRALGLDARSITEACLRSYWSVSQLITRRAAA